LRAPRQIRLLAFEIDDVLFAIRQKEVPWVRRFLTRLPTLAQAGDARDTFVGTRNRVRE
jgi:hypothetical protein